MVCLLRAPQLTVDWPLPTYLTPGAELGGLPKESGPQKSGLKAECSSVRGGREICSVNVGGIGVEPKEWLERVCAALTERCLGL